MILMENAATLGKSSLKVPRLGLGVMVWGQPTGRARWTPAQLAYGPSDGPQEEQAALEISLAAGVNLVDTASIYSNGASELRIAQLAEGKNLILATKYPPPFSGKVDNFQKVLSGSLERLQRTTIDLYQIHYPVRNLPIAQLMSFMADAVEAGKVNAVGVSNFSAEQMRLAHAELAKRGIPLASNQVQYSLVYRKPEVDGVLETCRELGVTLMAYSPLGMGILSGKYSSKKHASGFRRLMPGFRGQGIQAVQPLLELLREIGERYGKSPIQVALRWLIENELVLPIPGAKNGRQAQENVGALTFSLTEGEMEALNQASLPWRK
jgi:aryl-alcohol dehydrogenase-like predicted oxidoreductase